MLVKAGALSGALFAILLVVFCRPCGAFNLDTHHRIIYEGSEGSFFGYTTALNKNQWGYLALIGAPRANVTVNGKQVYRAGSLTGCNITTSSSSSGRCREVTLLKEDVDEIYRRNGVFYKNMEDNMWLGVSLGVRPDPRNNDIVTCGHRWRNQYHPGLHLVNGVCYVINGNLEESTVTKLLPLINKESQTGKHRSGSMEYWYALGQAGMSLAFTEDGSNLILGAPGIWSGTGSIVYYSSNPDDSNYIYKSPTVPNTPYRIKFNSYFGYSVATGKFFKNRKQYFAVGAPKDEYNGTVYIVWKITENPSVRHVIRGDQMGEYFGASVLGVDLNGDSFTDLLVGAPLHSLDSAGDEGKVYVFISNGQFLKKRILEESDELMGDRIVNSRFGTAMANIGDLNQDGFLDVAVGAPYESSQGAVYIYHGSSKGINCKYVQKIQPSSLNSKLSGFGIHISRGMDIDENGTPDVLIGSYASSNAVLLRSRPIIRLESELNFTPQRITMDQTTCVVRAANFTCVKIDACLTYEGRKASNALPFLFTLSITDPGRRGFFTENRTLMAERNITVQINSKICSQFELYLYEDIKDVISPIAVQFSYQIMWPSDSDERFYETYPVYQPESPTNITSEIPFQIDCGKDDECQADLVVSATRIEPSMDTPITIGKVPRIAVVITVQNVGEPAYLSQLLIHLPPELPTISNDYFCDVGNQQNNASLACNLGNPLRNGTKIDINIKLDATKIPPHTKYLEIVCRATTNSTEDNPADNKDKVPLYLETKADIGITGATSDNQIMYGGQRDSLPSIRHTYTIINHGPSPLQNIDIHLQIPYMLITPKGKKQIVSFTALEINSADELSVPVVCDDDSLNLKYVQPTSINGEDTIQDDRELIIGDEESPANDHLSEVSSEVLSDLNEESDVQHKSPPSERENTGNNSSSIKPRGYFTINCDSKDIECVSLRCSAAGFTSPRRFAQISLGFEFNFTNLDDYLSPWFHIEFISAGYVTVNDETVVQLHDHPNSTEIETVLWHEVPPPPEELAPWVVFASVSVGILLLLLILILFIKIGFFRRKEKDKMKKLKSDTQNTEQTIPSETRDSDVLTESKF